MPSRRPDPGLEPPPAELLTAAQAARELGVSLRTLYAYVSRGLLPSVAAAGDARSRRYPAAAVRRLAAHRAARRDPAFGARAAARGALAWGEPVLESAITFISHGRFYYRGHDVLRLAEAAGPGGRAAGGQFERVAELLWRGALPGAAPSWPPPPWLPALLAARPPEAAAPSPNRAVQALLPLVAGHAGREMETDPSAAAHAGRDVVALLAALACGGDGVGATPGGGVAARLAAAWVGREGQPAVAGGDAARLMDAALVLMADHELSVSAFATRVVASAGASPYAAVAAGIAAMEGAAHGGDTRRIAEMLAEVDAMPADGPATDATRLRTYVARHAREEGRVPGFGLRLYPDGDPRARLILRLTHAVADGETEGGRALAAADALAAAVLAQTGAHPTVDFALVSLARALGAPAHAPLTLFALGRSAGLLAHAIEQYRLARVLRPRAQYVGPPPLEPVRHADD